MCSTEREVEDQFRRVTILTPVLGLLTDDGYAGFTPAKAPSFAAEPPPPDFDQSIQLRLPVGVTPAAILRARHCASARPTALVARR